MEILFGLLVLGFGVWLWSRRGDGAHQKFREDMGYGEPVSELEPIFPEKKRKVLSNVEKKAAALDVLEDNDVAESLFEIVILVELGDYGSNSFGFVTRVLFHFIKIWINCNMFLT